MARRGGGHWPVITKDPTAGPIKKETVRRVMKAFAPYSRKASVVAVAIIITSALGVANPLLIKKIFDTALFPVTKQNVPLGVRLNRVYWIVGFMVAIPIVSGFIGVGQTYLANVVGQRVMQDYRNALYRHLQNMPLRFFTATRTGEIQSRLQNDVGGVESVVTDTASSILSNVVILLSTLIRDARHLVEADRAVAVPHGAVRLPPLPRGQGSPGGRPQHAALARRHERHHRGDAVRLRHPAVQGVRPAEVRDRPLPHGERTTGRARDPPADGGAVLLRHRPDLLLDHPGVGVSSGRHR